MEDLYPILFKYNTKALRLLNKFGHAFHKRYFSVLVLEEYAHYFPEYDVILINLTSKIDGIIYGLRVSGTIDLSKTPELRVLQIKSLSNASIFSFESLVNLKKLSIDCAIMDATLNSIELRHLDITAGLTDILNISSLTNLTYLRIKGNLKNIDLLATFTKLTHLELIGNAYPNEIDVTIVDNFPYLTSLTLEHDLINNEHFSTFVNLTELGIISGLEHISTLSSLSSLKLHSIDESDFDTIESMNLERLTVDRIIIDINKYIYKQDITRWYNPDIEEYSADDELLNSWEAYLYAKKCMGRCGFIHHICPDGTSDNILLFRDKCTYLDSSLDYDALTIKSYPTFEYNNYKSIVEHKSVNKTTELEERLSRNTLVVNCYCDINTNIYYKQKRAYRRPSPLEEYSSDDLYSSDDWYF